MPVADHAFLRHVPHFIGGKAVDSTAAFDKKSPLDGTVIRTVAEAGPHEVDRAVEAARGALKGDWSRLSVADRATALHRVADGIMARFEEFLAAETQDTGKSRKLAGHLDIPRGAANFRAFADLINQGGGEFFRTDTPDGLGAVNLSLRRPKGVIAVICPWNLPLLLMTWKVAPALACGNTVVVKPSEETPATAYLLGEVMRDSGIPDGVYNVVNGFGPGSAGEFLTCHPKIDAITFTGELATGEAIMRAAAVGVRNVSFEMGGKNPSLIFADCDMGRAVAESMRSVFMNTGQVCLSTERIYVERRVFDQFVERFQAEAKTLKIGTPDDPDATLGPLISTGHRDKVLSYYDTARRDGATTLLGGGVPAMPDPLGGGAWIQPTLWTGLPEDSAVIREEVFGPCAHIRPFDSEDEAVSLANDTHYGLCAALFTGDAGRAHRVGSSLEVGMCWVNSWFLRDLRTPFGGAKRSGIGREGGVHSLEFYTELTNLCLKL